MIEFKSKEQYSGTQQRFWRGEAKMLPAGYELLNAISIGVMILRAVFVQIFPDNLTCAVVKFGKILAGGTTSAIRVSKENYFEVGDYVQAFDGSVAKKITAIDRSNADYDVITCEAAVTGATQGKYLVESDNATGEGASPSPKYTPNMIVGAEKKMSAADHDTLDIAYDAIVIKDVVPEFPTEWLADGGICLKNNHSIKFIKQ